ncbi:uncharacterized protein LOC117344458 isoform X2 [Pecten maximus]|uniref:uncharacterized protein LOC117344458 isoform X2 n=1 Tax=Pecten maximus TaxID=6579 RepID=UPI001458D2D6|nr:uncharacterized protein LOC117344458 isoform X2 [Pecten maximus]
MAERQTRKRRRLNQHEISSQPYLTNSEMKDALKDAGIIISGNLNHKDLQKIYDDNVRNTNRSRVRNVTRTVASSEIDTMPNREQSATTDLFSSDNTHSDRGSQLISLESDAIFGTNTTEESAHASRVVPIAQPQTSQSTSASGINTHNMETMLLNTIKLCQQSMETMKQFAKSTATSSNSQEFTLQSAYEAQAHIAPAPTTSPPSQPSVSGQSANFSSTGIQAASISITDMVHPDVRIQILAGKDINLNTLLIPNFEPNKRSKDIDEQLQRNLTLDEFVVAFGRFKRIMTSGFPNRSQELDDYMAHIIETANVWPDKFYEYHKMFSAKCAIVLHQRNQKIDWSYGDPSLRQIVCAGSKVKCCDFCKSTTHVSSMCVTKQSVQAKGKVDRNHRNDVLGREIVFQNGAQICNNFNSPRSCSRPNCNFLHVCKGCKSNNHGKNSCPNKTNNDQPAKTDTRADQNKRRSQ